MNKKTTPDSLSLEDDFNKLKMIRASYQDLDLKDLVHYSGISDNPQRVLIVPISIPTPHLVQNHWSGSRIRSVKYSHTCFGNKWYQTELLEESFLCDTEPDGKLVFVDIDGTSHYIYELPS